MRKSILCIALMAALTTVVAGCSNDKPVSSDTQKNTTLNPVIPNSGSNAAPK